MLVLLGIVLSTMIVSLVIILYIYSIIDDNLYRKVKVSEIVYFNVSESVMYGYDSTPTISFKVFKKLYNVSPNLWKISFKRIKKFSYNDGYFKPVQFKNVFEAFKYVVWFFIEIHNRRQDLDVQCTVKFLEECQKNISNEIVKCSKYQYNAIKNIKKE